MRQLQLLSLLLCSCAAPAATTNPALGASAGSQDGAVNVATDSGAAGNSDTAGATDSASANADAADVKADTKADAKADTKVDAATGPADTSEIIAPKVVCGDSFCAEGEEDCVSCEYDCGACKVNCGDGKCATGESCATCAKDCGGCAGECGNGYCDPTENCATCAKDCGSCAPGCGNGVCDKTSETCDDCPTDCGKCSNEPCDPYTSKGCKDFEQCFPYSGGDLVCIGAGKLAKGQKCLPLVDCQKGLICINSTCAQICDASGKQPQYSCPAGKQCLEVGQPGKLSAGVGACL